MSRLALVSPGFLVLGLVLGCSSTPSLRNISAPGPTVAMTPAVSAEPGVSMESSAPIEAVDSLGLELFDALEATDADAIDPETFDAAYQPVEPAVAGAPLPRRRLLGGSYLQFRFGYWNPDTTWADGSLWTLTYGHYLTRLFAIEVEGGYFDGSGGGLAISGIPLMVNGRINLPILFLELYGGGGVGTYYYDTNVGDGWVGGGNVFLGGNIALLDKFVVGLEAKYYVSEKVEGIAPLDAFAVYLNLGLRL